MTGLEITQIALVLLNQLFAVLDLKAKVDRGELNPATLTAADLMPETAGEILARVRLEEAQKPHA